MFSVSYFPVPSTVGVFSSESLTHCRRLCWPSTYDDGLSYCRRHASPLLPSTRHHNIHTWSEKRSRREGIKEGDAGSLNMWALFCICCCVCSCCGDEEKKKKYHLRYIPHVQHPYILSIRSNAAHAIIQNGCIQIPLESGPFLGIWRLEV